jgi:hypothetical protein
MHHQAKTAKGVEMDAANRPSKLENLANLATILVSVLLSVVLIKVFLLPQSGPVRAARRHAPE